MADKEQTVLIRCKLHRAGGSKIPLFGKEYHFKEADAKADSKHDNSEVPHVCAIPFDDARAIYRLLAIKEGYELVDPNAELPPRPTQEKGQTIGNEKPAEEKKPIVISNGEGGEIDLTALEPAELRELAKTEFGLKVHHKWDDATVINKILEAARGSD